MAGPVLSPKNTVKAEVSLMQLAKNLGLVPDKLSVSLLSFARYFYMNLDPSLLLRLRHDSPKRSGAALALVAAEDKGVSLNAKALREYERAIDPQSRDFDREAPDGKDGDSSGGHSKDGNPDSGNPDSRKEAGENFYKLKPKEEEFSGQVIKKIAESIEGEKGVLGYLNKIPGKQKNRWIVIPFDMEDESKRTIVSLRILMEDEPGGRRDCVARMALDALSFYQGRGPHRKASGGHSSRHWLIVLDKPGRENSTGFIQTQPALPVRERKALEKEARELFGPLVRKVKIIEGSGLDFLIDNMTSDIAGDTALFSVDEEA